MEKIGYLETYNKEAQIIEKSSNRLQAFLAVLAAIVIAVSSVYAYEVTLGDALPMVITLLAYSFGARVFQKFAEIKK